LIERKRMNLNSGSLATGYPFAVTSGRIVGTLAKMLAMLARAPGDTRTRRGLVSICAAGGQRVVAILKR
jgi:acetyl-CoA C-acetyltransferase